MSYRALSDAMMSEAVPFVAETVPVVRVPSFRFPFPCSFSFCQLAY